MPPVPLAAAGHVRPTTKADDWCGEHPERQAATLGLRLVAEARQARRGTAARRAKAA